VYWLREDLILNKRILLILNYRRLMRIAAAFEKSSRLGSILKLAHDFPIRAIAGL